MSKARPSRPSAPYRDDPDAVSMHTTPDDYNYDDAPDVRGLPPPYADSVESSSAVAPASLVPRRPDTSQRTCHQEAFMFKNGKPKVPETLTFSNPRFDTDPVYLEERILSLAHEAPFPLVYILGTHRETVRRDNKTETEDVTDFRIVLDLQQYLMSPLPDDHSSSMTVRTVADDEKTHRGTITKCRAPGFKHDSESLRAPPTLKEWSHLYCASPRMLRIFRLRRTVTGFDSDYLQSRLEGLIRSTGYRGRVSVTIPIENRNVDLYTSNRINRWRMNEYIRWFFYLTFLWIFTWPYLFFATKRYAVVCADWAWSTTDGNGNKRYTTISEEQWFEKWHVGIKRLVLDKYKGEASDEVLAGVMERPEDPPMPGTLRTGNEGLDTAVNMLTQGFQVARSLSQGHMPRNHTQGGWGHDT